MFYSVFMFLLCFLDNSQKKLIIVCPPSEKITQFVSFDVLGAFRVRKGFLISAHFHQKHENPGDSSFNFTLGNRSIITNQR